MDFKINRHAELPDGQRMPLEPNRPHAVRSWLITSLLVVAAISSASAASQEPFYRKRQALEVGALAISKMKVFTVAIAPQRDEGIDDVDSLKLSEGTVIAIYGDSSHTGDPVISGEVAAGTADDPAADIRGQFRWQGGQLQQVSLSRLTLRLRKVRLLAPVLGGRITIPSTEAVFINVINALVFDGSTSAGELMISVPNGASQDCRLTWGTLAFITTLRLRQAQLITNLGSRTTRLVSGQLYTDSAQSEKPTTPIEDFADHRVQPGHVRLSQLRVTIDNASGVIQAERVSIERPQVTYLPMGAIPVAGVLEVRVENPKATASRIDHNGASFRWPDDATVLVFPDPFLIMERLNRFGLVEPDDYLIPLGDSAIKYISLAALHEVLAFASRVSLEELRQRETMPALREQKRVVSGVPVDAVLPFVAQNTINTIPNQEPGSGPESKLRPGVPILDVQHGVALPMEAQERKSIRDLLDSVQWDGIHDRKTIDLIVQGQAMSLPPVGVAKVVGNLVGKIFNSVFGSRASVGTALWLRTATHIDTRLGPAAFKLGYESAAEVPMAAGHVAGIAIRGSARGVQGKLRAYANTYLENAQPATLRYSRRATSPEYIVWEQGKRKILNGEIQSQQEKSAEAEQQNRKKNEETHKQAHDEQEKVKAKVKEYREGGVLPNQPGEGNSGTDAGSGTGGAGTGGGGGTDPLCPPGKQSKILPNGEVVLCTPNPVPDEPRR